LFAYENAANLENIIKPYQLIILDEAQRIKNIRLVLENIADPDLNVEKLSADLAVSRRQLHRKMVAITGDSPNRFIRTVRLNRAAELLKNKSGNVTEIAYEVGFNNLSYFAKSFKEEFGILPSEMV